MMRVPSTASPTERWRRLVRYYANLRFIEGVETKDVSLSTASFVASMIGFVDYERSKAMLVGVHLNVVRP